MVWVQQASPFPGVNPHHLYRSFLSHTTSFRYAGGSSLIRARARTACEKHPRPLPPPRPPPWTGSPDAWPTPQGGAARGGERRGMPRRVATRRRRRPSTPGAASRAGRTSRRGCHWQRGSVWFVRGSRQFFSRMQERGLPITRKKFHLFSVPDSCRDSLWPVVDESWRHPRETRGCIL